MIRHDSMRGYFAYELYQYMSKDDSIWLLVGDLGYKVFDDHFRDFPDRCINTGAAEVAMMNIAVGLALEGKIPVVYSITSFLLYRPFEVIRTYINHEHIPVKMVGSGRDKDYIHDGISHWSEDARQLFYPDPEEAFSDSVMFGNIYNYWPKDKEEIPEITELMFRNKKPTFLSLRR